MNTKTKTQQPQQELTGPDETVQTPEAVIKTVQDMSEDDAANVVQMAQSKGKRKNLFETTAIAVTEQASNKIELLQHVREQAEKADKLASQANAKADEITPIAQDIALTLYRGRVNGIFSNDEVSTLLGEGFGFKLKGDSKTRVSATHKNRSATPYGWGEAIRKRVVRSVNAAMFVRGDERAAGAFFNGLEPSDVQPLLEAVNSGERSIWTAYDLLGKLKADKTGQRPKDAFNPKKIAAITSTLGENMSATVEIFGQTPGLFEAYLGLYQMVSTVGSELPQPNSAAA